MNTLSYIASFLAFYGREDMLKWLGFSKKEVDSAEEELEAHYLEAQELELKV